MILAKARSENVRYRIRINRTAVDQRRGKPQEEFILVGRWLTVKQVSNYLQISVAKVYQMAQGGEIPCCRLGQQWRFDREEIDRWMRRR